MSAPIYLFDGHCVLCSRGVQYALKYETKPHVKFVAIHSDKGRELAVTHGVDPDEPHTALYIDEAGTIRHVDKQVKTATAGQDIARKLDELGFPRVDAGMGTSAPASEPPTPAQPRAPAPPVAVP